MTKVYYLEDMTQEELNKLALERNVLQSNWNSLREWLEARKELYNTGIKDEYKVILDKMNELEGVENESNRYTKR